MRISGLAAVTGVPLATVKYYLREGLLHPGRQTSATQARYDETHVARLRLVRALLDVGGLSIASARGVLSCLDPGDVFEALGRTQEELPPRVTRDVDLSAAREAIAALGWQVPDESAALRQLAVAMQAVREVGLPLTPDRLQAYAKAAHLVAEQEIDRMPQTSVADALTYAVVGTVLYEPVLLALRRLAHQDVSARRFASST